MARTVVREIRTVTVNSTPGQIVGPNPGRLYLVVSPPAIPLSLGTTTATVTGAGRNMAVTGAALSYIPPAGVLARLTAWSVYSTFAGWLVTLRLRTAGIYTRIDSASSSRLGLVNATLGTSDRIDVWVETAVAGATGDMMIAVDLAPVAARVTLGLGAQPVLDQGLTIAAGLAPLVLPGELVQGDIYAVADVDGRTISVGDVFLA